MSGDEYVTIECMFVGLRPKAVKIDVDGHQTWIPRSCIHGCDDSSLAALDGGNEFSLRMFRWIAEREGLL